MHGSREEGLVKMDQYELIRTSQRVYKKSIRQIAKETGHSRNTVRKVLSGQEPKYRRNKEAVCRVMDPVGTIVEQWLQADRESPKKQRHTSHRVYTRLLEEYDFKGAESTVRQWTRKAKARLGLKASVAVVPLDPEAAREAEVDWGSAWVRIGGEQQQVKIFCMRARYSGKAFGRPHESVHVLWRGFSGFGLRQPHGRREENPARACTGGTGPVRRVSELLHV